MEPDPLSATTPVNVSGRRASITRNEILEATLGLLGPHRSLSSLSLREVARATNMAPNSFYRHFSNMDELAIALIDQAGTALRGIIGDARRRATPDRNVVRTSVEIFMEQLRSSPQLLHVLLREGSVGSTAFKQAVERELRFFEDELCSDLKRLAHIRNTGLFEPELTAKAITRLVFAMGSIAMDLPKEQYALLTDQISIMVRMIIVGSQTMSTAKDNRI